MDRIQWYKLILFAGSFQLLTHLALWYMLGDSGMSIISIWMLAGVALAMVFISLVLPDQEPYQNFLHIPLIWLSQTFDEKTKDDPTYWRRLGLHQLARDLNSAYNDLTFIFKGYDPISQNSWSAYYTELKRKSTSLALHGLMMVDLLEILSYQLDQQILAEKRVREFENEGDDPE